MLSALALGLACGGATGIAGDTPTEAYKRLYAAVKSKDTEAIKKQLTKKTIAFGAMTAQRYNQNEARSFENGLTATTFSEALPTIRDERVKDDMGAVEVWNSKDSKWEDLPYIKEDGMWKLAVGEAFAKTYKQPGFGRDRIEKDAANAVGNSATLPTANSNSITVSNIPMPSASTNNKVK